MVDVRNYNSRALPYGVLLTKVFKHFRVTFSRQLNEYIDKGFSITTIKRGISIDSTEGEDEGEEKSSHQYMEVKGNLEVKENLQVPPPQTEETHEEPSTQVLQLQLQEEDMIHGEDPIMKGIPRKKGLYHKEGLQHGFLNTFAS